MPPTCYSTRDHNAQVTLVQAIARGYAPDGGLYMPSRIARLPQAFIDHMSQMSLPDIAFAIANHAIGGIVAATTLRRIVADTVNFPIPLVHTMANRFALELFHGPTLNFKDVGARFMARTMVYLMRRAPARGTIHVIVATSGDTGAAVANSFYGLDGVRVHVLFPRDEVNELQQAQFTTLGGNVTALAVNGTYDDCKALVAAAFDDEELNRNMRLTTATSVNIARILPQTFYYFDAVAQLQRLGIDTSQLVIAIPCANLGNLASGLMARAMGLPVKRFVAVENANNIFYNYMQTGRFTPRPSVSSIAPALDAGNPANFERVVDLAGDRNRLLKLVHAYSYDDADIVQTMQQTYNNEHYLVDPHGAIAYRALQADLSDNETGVFLATAHPAKLKGTVERIVGCAVDVPAPLARSLATIPHPVPMTSGYTAFRRYLTQQSVE